MSDHDSSGTEREDLRVLIEEWRMAAKDERGERQARVAYQDCAAELEYLLEADQDE